MGSMNNRLVKIEKKKKKKEVSNQIWLKGH